MADEIPNLPPMGHSKTMGSPKYKKAPDAPKRFKSAFIIFSAEKHKEIKEKLASQGRVEKVRSRKMHCVSLILVPVGTGSCSGVSTHIMPFYSLALV